MATGPRHFTDLRRVFLVDYLWTIGFEGRHLAQVVESLLGAGVGQVVDVRRVALTRQPGFSKKSLAAALGEAGISYVHRPKLGYPATGAGTGTGRPRWAGYEAHLATVPEALAGLALLVSQAPTALLCSEVDAGECHRVVLAGRLAAMGFEVVHL